MSDFTIDDTMAEIRYELDDREIYNDIRSEIGIMTTETVVDADPTYSWRYWRRTMTVPADGYIHMRVFTASELSPIGWELRSVSAKDLDGNAYYDYQIKIVSSDDSRTKGVEIINTGSEIMVIKFRLYYKYKTADRITHEELVPETLTVRATDATSIQKYGRRVMNLTWSEGTEDGAMQVLVNHYLVRYKEPIPRLMVIVKGTTDTLRTQIITREISDLLTVVCAEIGLNSDFFINSITLKDGPVGVPVCTWGLEEQRTEETLTIFVLDTSELDGPHILGS